MAEYDERVLEYQKINHGKYIGKLKNNAGLEDEVKKLTPCICICALTYYQRLGE